MPGSLYKLITKTTKLIVQKTKLIAKDTKLITQKTELIIKKTKLIAEKSELIIKKIRLLIKNTIYVYTMLRMYFCRSASANAVHPWLQPSRAGVAIAPRETPQPVREPSEHREREREQKKK